MVLFLLRCVVCYAFFVFVLQNNECFEVDLERLNSYGLYGEGW